MIHRCSLFALLVGAALTLGAQDEEPRKPKPSDKTQRAPKQKVTTGKPVQPLDINTASKDALMRLPGVDADMAAKVIVGRPYTSKYDLVTKGIMPRTLHQQIKQLIAAVQPSQPAPKK